MEPAQAMSGSSCSGAQLAGLKVTSSVLTVIHQEAATAMDAEHDSFLLFAKSREVVLNGRASTVATSWIVIPADRSFRARSFSSSVHCLRVTPAWRR